MGDWADEFTAWRFNPNHKGAGAGGGEFTSAGNAGSGSKGVKAAPHPKSRGKASAPFSGAHSGSQAARKRQIEAQISSDEAQIRVLGQQLRAQEAALKASASANAKAKAATAKTVAAGKAAASGKAPASAKKTVTVTAAQHRARIRQIEQRISALRQQVTRLRAEAAAL